MQFKYFLHDSPILPTKRTIHRIRRRYGTRNSWQRWLLLLAIAFVLIRQLQRYARPSATLQYQSRQNGLAGCFDTQRNDLITFDEFMYASKASGAQENELENRWQEDVWDTLLHPYALFPAWSDMTWNVPQYGRALSRDLALVQALAASAVQLTGTDVPTSPLPFQNANSPIRINYVHHRLDRLRGLQYMVNFAPRHGSVNSTIYNLLVQQSLNQPSCRVSLGKSPNVEPVYILLPYGQREERLRLFLQNYLFLCTEHQENLILIISVLSGSSEDLNTVHALKEEVFGKEQSVIGDSVKVHENEGDVEGKFSRGVAIREAAKLAPSPDSVLFQCDVDMIIRPTFFDRCRHNTIRGSQIYYPVFYSLYPYANAQPTIVERNGYWRKTSFGMTCIRKADFEMVGAYDDAETRFHGWGSEDVYQFEKIRNTTSLIAFRAVEPALMHRWHSKACDTKSSEYINCMKTNFMTMGHPLRIGPVLLESLQDVDLFFRRLESS